MKAFIIACSSVLSLGWNDNKDLADLLLWHNVYRCMHDVPLLTWDDTIAANAQRWANQCGGNMQHSSNEVRANVAGFQRTGENLYRSTQASGKEGAKMWYDEIESTWGGLVSSFGMGTGHYTQLVWKGTTKLGCGHSAGLVVCQYGEAGNMGGAFESNVNGPVKTEEECQGPHSPSGGGSGGSGGEPREPREPQMKSVGGDAGPWMVNWVQRQLGQRIHREGYSSTSCWDLVKAALEAASAHGFHVPTGHMGNNGEIKGKNGWVWSSHPISWDQAQPGDVAQFASWYEKITHEGGSWETLSTGHVHSALVVSVDGQKLNVYEQNPSKAKAGTYHPGLSHQGVLQVFRIAGGSSPSPSPGPSPSPPVTAPSSSCHNFDADATCDYWKDQGWCDPSSGYSQYTLAKCQKSCQTCPGSGDPGDKTCANIDTDEYCEYWKGEGWCSPSSRYYAYTSSKCPKSCQTCGELTE